MTKKPNSNVIPMRKKEDEDPWEGIKHLIRTRGGDKDVIEAYYEILDMPCPIQEDMFKLEIIYLRLKFVLNNKDARAKRKTKGK